MAEDAFSARGRSKSTIALISQFKLGTKGSKSRNKLSTARLLGLSRLGLGSTVEEEEIKMENSDRSIYDELNMVFTPPRVDRKLVTRFECTYIMQPKRVPDHWEARRLIERIVHSYINYETEYQPKEAEDIVRKISVNIKRAVKGLQYDRYKVVAFATIGEKKDQSLHIMGKFLWDFDFDRFSTYTFENQFLYIIASVFMLYYE